MTAKTLVATAGVFAAALVSACVAHADPPPFPDINSYTPVNADDYAITIDTPGISHKETFFITPDGVICTVRPGLVATCSGNNLPGVPPAAPTEGGTPRVNSIGTGTPMHPSGEALGTSDTIQGQKPKTLPPNHSITVEGVTCGVDDAGMTACKDPQGRGFILSPSWSGWLPHV